jgi:two-component sensor histidine kinase
MGIYWALLSVVIIGIALRDQVSYLRIGIWVIVYFFVQSYRYYLMINFSKIPDSEGIVSWGRWFSFATIASGLTWGLAPVIMFPAGSLIYQMFLIVCLSGIAAAAAAVYSPVALCYFPTVLAILVPLSARFFYQGQEVDTFVGIVLLVLAAALLMTGRQMNDALTEGLRLRFQNKALLDSVTEQKRIAENLLKEIHHRVKNNLQVICSLVRLQGRQLKSEETRTIFKDTEIRVRSMATLHEVLYQSEDLERIPAKDYFNNLATQILESYRSDRRNISLTLNVGDVSLTVDTAIPCGLIINELMTNSLKHAFSDGDKGEISILLHPKNENELELVIKDNGRGLPRGTVYQRPQSLGLNLVRAFVKQLRGSMELNGHHGTEFRMSFQDAAASERR